jgi:hypothetical protein
LADLLADLCVVGPEKTIVAIVGDENDRFLQVPQQRQTTMAVHFGAPANLTAKYDGFWPPSLIDCQNWRILAAK